MTRSSSASARIRRPCSARPSRIPRSRFSISSVSRRRPMTTGSRSSSTTRFPRQSTVAPSVGCRYRPLHDEVHGRPWRRGWWLHRRFGQVRLGGPCREVSWSGPLPTKAIGVVYTRQFGNEGAFITKATAQLMRDLGSIQSPQNAFLLNMGLSLHLRVARHTKNGLAVAEFLNRHPKVTWVRYADLPGDESHDLAKKYHPTDLAAW